MALHQWENIGDYLNELDSALHQEAAESGAEAYKVEVSKDGLTDYDREQLR